MEQSKTQFMVQFAVLAAIEAIFCFTPLGSLPAIGPIVATLAAIPVVITAITLGTKAGAAMGTLTGFFSFLVWTFMPPTPITAFIFTPFYSFGEFSGNLGSLVICFVPRILVGVVAGLSYQTFSRVFSEKNTVSYLLSGALGSLTNTFLVMGGVAVFFGQQYSSIAGKSMIAIIGVTILTSGIPEAIVNAIVAPAICKPLQVVMARSVN